MICSSCRRAFFLHSSTRFSITRSQARPSSTAPSTQPAPRQPSSDIRLDTAKTSPSAISSNTPGLSQPLSTPMLPSTSGASRPVTLNKSKPPQLVSSVAGGMALSGLGYLKSKPVVLAMEDDEYPEWLWKLVDTETGTLSRAELSAADVAALPKEAREKYLKKQEKRRRLLPKPIPLHEQSKDLTQPGDSAETSMQRRREVTQSLRGTRRKAIKEKNFLKRL